MTDATDDVDWFDGDAGKCAKCGETLIGDVECPRCEHVNQLRMPTTWNELPQKEREVCERCEEWLLFDDGTCPACDDE